MLNFEVEFNVDHQKIQLNTICIVTADA